MATTEVTEPPTVTPSNQNESSEGPAPSQLERELESLSASFKGHCRVSSDDKRFFKVVKLHPENLDIVFNFKLTDAYPASVPVMQIRSESLEEDEIFDLSTFLTQTAESMSPVSMETLVNEALGWLKEGGIDIKGTRNAKKSNKDDQPKGNTSKKKQRKNKKEKDEEEREQRRGKKKPPMRTAMDVVERIQWDPELPQDQFLVGYLDRMMGLQEKYFNAFSWEDIASVDYTVLAIPKHRIQYFKYKHEIVWDKRCRLDNVFGSIGSGKTIRDVIAKIDGNASRDNANEDGENEGQGRAERDADSDYYDDEDGTDSDSDSDDGINVVIGGEGASGGRFSGDDEAEGAENESDDDAGYNKFWRDKLRPNHFLALRITDTEIRKRTTEIQDHIARSESRLRECSIPRAALHITLCTVGLETPEQVQNAVQCLREARDELAPIVPKTKKLKFKGVDHFFNRVVYGRVVECPPEFHEFVDHLKLCLNERGIEIRDYHEFVPHMTLMKISRPFSRATGKKYVPPWLYSCFGDTELGEQAIDNLHLCEMGDNRQDDGFYISPISLDL